MTQAVVSSRLIAEHPPVEIVEKRDDHTRVWEIVREVETTHPDGSTTVDTVKSYIHEKASGLCCKDAGGNYIPSIAEWRETPDGFIIDRCPYRLAMGKTIGVAARYTVEGNDLLLRPAYLIMSDGVNRADPRPLTPETPGSICPDNPSVLRFPSAFGEGYDLEYVAEKGGFHQNLMIAKPPEIPEGFDPDSTSIHLYTELNLDQYLASSGCELSVEGELVNTSAADLVTESSRGGCISFNKEGRVLHAFSVSQVTDSSGPGALDKQTTAEKRLMKDPASGKAYLVESVPFSYFTDSSPTYPITWDYESKSGSVVTQTWEPRYTYRITGNVTVSGTLTILPGTTVKLDPSKKIIIASGGKVIARGEPYNYIVFTNSSDNNCGEPIPGAPGGRWSIGLDLQSAAGDNDSAIQYCKFHYGNTGVHLVRTLSAENPVAHNIFDDMATLGVAIESCSANMLNNLMTSCSYFGIYLYAVGTATVTNNTIDHSTSFMGVWDSGSSSFTATDNLLSHCPMGIHSGAVSPVIHHNRFFDVTIHVDGRQNNAGETLTANPYQTGSLGDFFLNGAGAEFGSKLKDKGSRTASDAGLSESFFTVIAPTTISQSEYTGPVTWSQIDHDTGVVDIGYHHCRTDTYLEAGLTISGASGVLMIGQGVVVGIRGDKYLKASNQGGKLLLVGDPSAGALNIMTCSKALSMNIESPRFGDTTGNPYIYLSSGASEGSSIQYTRMTWLGWGVLIDPGRWLREPIQHNVFSLGYYGIHAGIDSGNVLLNNLFYDNVQAAYAEGDAQGRAAVRNCTFDKNTTGLRVYAGSGETLPITDCLFTNSLAEGILINAGAGTIANDYNAYWQNTVDISGGARGPHSLSDKENPPEITQSPYSAPIEDGWNLHYRLDQSSPVIDAGCRTAASAWLDEFTTAPEEQNRTDVKEVDIGFHFPLDRVNLLQGGYRQTDIALRWNNMTEGCLRAFSFDGHCEDEMGNEEGVATAVSYPCWRYHPPTDHNVTPGSEHLKFDYHKCATFNGSSSKVNIGNSNDGDTGIRNLPEFTIAAWIWPLSGDAGDGGRIYDKGPLGLYVDKNDGVKLKGHLNETEATSSNNLATNKWSHVVMTWDGSAIRLYVNGAACCDPVTATQGDDSAYDGVIGNDAGGTAPFYGRIADLFLYDRPLDEEGLDDIDWLALASDFKVTPNLGAMGKWNEVDGAVPWPIGQMQSAAYAVEDNANNIWVSEFGGHRVSKLNQDGKVLKTIGGRLGQASDQFNGPWGMDLADGKLYIADSNNYRVQVFNLDGTFDDNWGTEGTGDGQFHWPLDISVAGGYVYVAECGESGGNPRIQKFTTGGGFVTKWGGRAQPGLTFSGTGNHDLSLDCWGFTGTADVDYQVEITETGSPPTPDEFKWSDDAGTHWHTGSPCAYCGATHYYSCSTSSINLESAQATPTFHFWIRFGDPRGHASEDKWTWTAQAKKADPNASSTGIETICHDDAGKLWVLYPGWGHDKNVAKKFDLDGNMLAALDVEDGGAHGLAYANGYLYTGGGDMSTSNVMNRWKISDGSHTPFGAFGTGRDEVYGFWGCYVTPRNTLLTTDWFACKIQEWTLGGAWIRTIQFSLRSDGYSTKCLNNTQDPQQAYQAVSLPEDDCGYRVQFLAFTKGGDVTADHVVPFAAYTGDQQPSNRIAQQDTHYEPYVLTFVDPSAGQDQKACFIWGDFDVGSGETAQPWKVGVQVQGMIGGDPMLVYVASLTCFEKPQE